MREVLLIFLLLMLGLVFLYLCWEIAKMLHKLNNDNDINIDYDEED